MPVNSREGVQVDFNRLLSWMPQSTVANYNTMLSRLSKLPQQITEIIALLTEGNAAGITPHMYAMVRINKLKTKAKKVGGNKDCVHRQNWIVYTEKISSRENLFLTKIKSICNDPPHFVFYLCFFNKNKISHLYSKFKYIYTYIYI